MIYLSRSEGPSITMTPMFLYSLTTRLKSSPTVLIALSTVGLLMFAPGCAQQVGHRDFLPASERQNSVVESKIAAMNVSVDASDTSPCLSPAIPTTLLSTSSTLSERQSALDAREAQITCGYTHAQQVCYSRFFVNPCLAKAHARYRQEKEVLRADQWSIEDAKRAQRARERREKERFPVAKKYRSSSASAPVISRAQTRARYEHEVQRRAENVRRFEAKQDAAKRHRMVIERRRDAHKRANSKTRAGATSSS